MTSTPIGQATATPDYQATGSALLTAPPQVTAQRPTGIFDAGVEFYHEGYRMQNAWQGLVHGYWADVVAGAHSSDPQQGVIFSAWEWPNAAIGQFYKTPGWAGSVRIVAEEQYRLTLEAEGGAVFYWDIPSQSFVASLAAVAPTITPPPTHTPTPSATFRPGGYPPLPSATSPTPSAFDARPQTVVIYADLDLSGPPRLDWVCRFASVPVLRIWGDGLAFARIPDPSGRTSGAFYHGLLSDQQINDLLDSLNQAGFFGDWTPEPPSPAAYYLHFGVNAPANSRERSFSSLEPQFYTALLGQLVPMLTPVSPGELAESRIVGLNTTRECVTVTPAP